MEKPAESARSRPFNGKVKALKIVISSYSRTGNTRNIAARIGREFEDNIENEVVVEEIKESGVDRGGVSGYVKAGKDALSRRRSEIITPVNNPGNFDLVVIGGPVWAWTVSPPVSTYCSDYGVEAIKVAFFCCMGGSGAKKTFSEMQKLCKKIPLEVISFKDRELKTEEIILRKKIQNFVAACQE